MARKRSERWEALYTAAQTMFLEQGVAVTRVEDILSTAGISIGSFYHHFDNKVDLAARLYIETMEQLHRSLLEVLLPHEEAREGIEAVVRFFLDWTLAHPLAMRYMLHCREPDVARAVEKEEQHVNAHFYGHVQGWLQPHIEAGTLRPLKLETIEALWIGPVQLYIERLTDTYGFFTVASVEALRAEFEAAAPLYAEAAWNALRQQPHA
ncbi:MAG: TetR/AcrR family transcriptional regulator [Anaerolineae bacterium]